MAETASQNKGRNGDVYFCISFQKDTLNNYLLDPNKTNKSLTTDR